MEQNKNIMKTEETFQNKANQTRTLCWDCAKATGFCSWSSADGARPVKGWKAKPVTVAALNRNLRSYIVFECPLFERDAIYAGQKRYP